MKVKCENEVAQLCLTLSDPMDCSLPGASVHGIFQARALERVAEWLLSKNLQTINAGEGVEKTLPSYTAGVNISWCSHYGEQYESSLKKLKIELLYDPATPLLGIY